MEAPQLAQNTSSEATRLPQLGQVGLSAIG